MDSWHWLYDGAVTDALGWTLVHALWQDTLVALILLALLRLLPRRFANARYGLSGLALAVSVLLPILTFLHVYQPLAALAATTSITTLTSAVAGFGSASLAQEPGWREWLGGALPWLSQGWLLGVLLLSSKTGLEYYQVRGLSRRDVRPVPDALMRQALALAAELGVRRRFRLLESLSVSVPMVVGWAKPVILLPASVLTGLKAEQLSMILAHELAHVRRHDYLVNLAQTLAEILLFFHPAVWWISRQMRSEREHCCDDIAVALCHDPIGYARTLADTAELSHHHHGLAVAATGGDLKLRVTRLFAGHACHPHWGSRSLAALTAVSLLAGIGVAARVQAMMQPAPRPEPKPAAVAAQPAETETRTEALPMLKPLADTKPMRTTLSEARPAVVATAVRKPEARTQAALPAAAKPNPEKRLAQVASALKTRPSAVTPESKPVEPKPLLPAMAERADAPAPVQLASLAPRPAPSLSQVREAVAVKTPMPGYPKAALRAGWEADVKVRFVVGIEGRIESLAFLDTEVKPAFRRSIEAALEHWRFEPRIENGVAVSQTVQREFSFHLDDEGGCRLVTGSRICQ